MSPHFDDETLFASYICLREHPLVLFCFDGAPRHGSFETRWAEAQKATAILGCESLALRESPENLTERLSSFDPEHVWAPWAEDGGIWEHNIVGDAAQFLWLDRVSFYTTYTPDGRTTLGTPVEPLPNWIGLKRSAIGCYQSQLTNRLTRPHFERGMDEYELPSVFADA